MLTIVIAPAWLMLLFDLNRMFPPTTLSVIAPAWLMPMPDWLALLPMTVRSPPPAKSVSAPRLVAVPVPLAVPVIVSTLPLIKAVATTPLPVFVVPVTVTVPVCAVLPAELMTADWLTAVLPFETPLSVIVLLA